MIVLEPVLVFIRRSISLIQGALRGGPATSGHLIAKVILATYEGHLSFLSLRHVVLQHCVFWMQLWSIANRLAVHGIQSSRSRCTKRPSDLCTTTLNR
jgi:hypothetical protein